MNTYHITPFDFITVSNYFSFVHTIQIGVHVRFRLGGYTFPPQIYFKIYTHRPLCDVNAFAPRDYMREKEIEKEKDKENDRKNFREKDRGNDKERDNKGKKSSKNTIISSNTIKLDIKNIQGDKNSKNFNSKKGEQIRVGSKYFDTVVTTNVSFMLYLSLILFLILLLLLIALFVQFFLCYFFLYTELPI